MTTPTAEATTTHRPRRTQADRSATTTAALVKAARELFAEQGFAATSRDQIAERAGVTRGALYHHFDSKTAVAAAVVAEARRTSSSIGSSPRQPRPKTSGRSCTWPAGPTWTPPPTRRSPASWPTPPAVLGVAACRQLDAESCLPLLEDGFARAAERGCRGAGRPRRSRRLAPGLPQRGGRAHRRRTVQPCPSRGGHRHRRRVLDQALRLIAEVRPPDPLSCARRSGRMAATRTRVGQRIEGAPCPTSS